MFSRNIISNRLNGLICAIFLFILVLLLFTGCGKDTVKQNSISDTTSSTTASTKDKNDKLNSSSETSISSSSITISSTKATSNDKTSETKENKSFYVLNTKTMKVHTSNCRHVSEISDENKESSTKTKDELVNEGYTPCGTCRPW